VRITLVDIAQATGLTTASVSMALRGRANISKATQAKVHDAAKKLGYVPDPLLSSLSNYRQSGQSRRKPSATIVFLTMWSSALAWREGSGSPHLCRIFAGMEEQGERLGYKIENFWLNEPGMTNKRASRILFQRGVRGLVIPCQPVPRVHLRLDWSKFAVVVERPALSYPRFEYVNADQYQSVRLAFHHLRHLGYKRPGLAICSASDRLSLNAWRAGYNLEMESYHIKQGVIQVYNLKNDSSDIKNLRKWVQINRVDVVLGPGHIHEIVANSGYAIPKAIGAIALDLKETDGTVAGINPNAELEGKHAVNMIHLALQTATYGIPALVHGVNIEGSWINGKTVRAQSR
jgi:LacI family transcriptional regulator